MDRNRLETTIKEKLPSWNLDADHKILSKSFPLKSYFKGLSFLQSIGWLAQQLNHHPDIHLQFHQITISLTTHDEGNQVGAKDIELACRIEQLWF